MAWAENVAVGTAGVVDAVVVLAVAVPVLAEEGCVDDANTALYLSTIALEISIPNAFPTYGWSACVTRPVPQA